MADKKYKCGICYKQYKTKTGFKKHQPCLGGSGNALVNIECPECGKTFKTPNLFHNHRPCTGPKNCEDFPCLFCPKVYGTEKARHAHTTAKHGPRTPKRWGTDYSPEFSLPSQSQFEPEPGQHISLSQPLDLTSYGHGFDLEGQGKMQNLPSATASLSDEEEFECAICGEKGRLEDGFKQQHPCQEPDPENARINVSFPTSGRSFSTPNLYQVHKPTCPGSLDDPLPCDFCKRLFWTDKGRQEHMISYHGPKGIQPATIFPGLGDIERASPKPWPWPYPREPMTMTNQEEEGNNLHCPKPSSPLRSQMQMWLPNHYRHVQQFDWPWAMTPYPTFQGIPPRPFWYPLSYPSQVTQTMTPMTCTNPFDWYWAFGCGERGQEIKFPGMRTQDWGQTRNTYPYPYPPSITVPVPTDWQTETQQSEPEEIQQREEGEKWQCRDCFIYFKTKYELEKHDPACPAAALHLKFYCEFCPKSFCNKTGLRIHASDTHGQGPPRNEEHEGSLYPQYQLFSFP